MFTGLVEEKGTVAQVEHTADGARLRIETVLAGRLGQGDSIAVNGVCLTAVEPVDGSFAADVMNETLGKTTLGPLAAGDAVNLELPLRAGDPLGGHIVQGHVDGTGTVGSVTGEGFSTVIRVDAPEEILRYVAAKGSVALDGVSLTVAEVGEGWFSVALIPETQERTTLGGLRSGRSVNIEVDVLAKYVERLVTRQ
jgi:riboflavin synthase